MLSSQEFVVENRDQYFGGLVIASQFADDNLRELRKFAGDVKLPVIFIDHVPPQADAMFPSNTSWVTVRDSAGGTKAVEAVVALGIEPKRILVIAGPAKKDRHEFFRQGIEERWPTCTVRITTDGGFNRRTAEEIVYDILAEAIAQKTAYDVIFCTTDSMTLGCLDAMQRLDWKGESRPYVIGYDGIEATRRLILRRQTQLKRVVVQDVEKLAGTAIQELEAFRSGQGNGVVWVEPTLFPG
jgi:DNA-binding LacI/PurR family transcriptional regulator